MENTQSNRYIGIGINVLRRRGKGGQYHTETFCPGGQHTGWTSVGWNHYWHKRLAATLWSMNGFWGTAWFASWGQCIAALLPTLVNSSRVDAPPGVVELVRGEVANAQTTPL